MNRTLPINRMQQYFKEQQQFNHAAAKQLGDGLTYVGGMGGNHNSGDEPFFPETARYECPKEPERHPNFRQKAKGEFVHKSAEPAQKYVWGDIPFVVLAMALSGAALLVEFGAMVCGVVGRMFGGR